VHALRSYLPCPRRLPLAQQPIAGLVTHVVFAGPVHVVHIDLVAGQDGHGANELPARVEHEQARPGGFSTSLGRSRRSSRLFCRLPASLWAGAQ
jgi:hypothetical protein